MTGYREHQNNLRRKGKVMKNIRDLYKIQWADNKEKQEPEYILEFEMDANDADYIRDKTTFSAAAWNEMPDFFFLMLAYLSKGYCGKFSHGESWGNYYGHHWEENKHGLTEMINEFIEMYEIICYNEYGFCHSFSEFHLYYKDENKVIYDVEIPDIDDMFDTEAEMIFAMETAYRECVESDYDN